MQLNLIFHNIVKSEKDIANKYTVTLDYYLDLVEKIERLIKGGKTSFSDYRVYFDDGYISFHELIYPKINDFSKYTLAVVTNDVNKAGFLDDQMLIEYDKKGIVISSHGVSHASLAFYENGVLQKTLANGKYENTSRGQNKSLSENEVIFQFKESQKYLQNLLGHRVSEFVFPYGLYNKQTLSLNKTGGYYKYLVTCDEYLDSGLSLRPRFLIDHERITEATIRKILNLR
ncbi:MAG: hypothetical protein US68_C0033G0006 [Candidatus Shapirobacteria bacterium GW2011_GWE1_38_10]|uniref:NodB homology domain-containing protein n=1 Tax=Candidatus Shapirobacteria bacterium GW2011_GWE1_38_10 TaxID=1618488 RepID=A0A0G0KGY5_9BACT|nr:MAG: hypothetical protein US68_C0033G0006 [Candidatus Shapirobacteria bacterium GW2011_GWE1_38_10]